MCYRVVFRPRAARDFRKLPQDIKERLQPHIDALTSNPRPRGVEKFAGTANGYRIRVGTYRVLYEIQDDVLVVYVVKIAHRRDVYR